MVFYNRNGQEINQNEWINKFQPIYYLGGPTYDHHITRGNQGSKFVEDEIEKILKNGLNSTNIPLIIAWKIGAIDHHDSEQQKAIIYKNNFYQTSELKTRFGPIKTTDIIRYCRENFDDLINTIKDAERLFDLLYKNRGQNNRFGPVYCISLVYFFTQGAWPIYDRYAHTAIEAIFSGKLIGDTIPYRQINNWDDYQKYYVNKMEDLFDTKNIPREIDRSLWVYGHFFKN